MAYFSAEKADSESIGQLILRCTYLQASLLWCMVKMFRGERVVDGGVAVKDAWSGVEGVGPLRDLSKNILKRGG